jgi:peptide/nickel transport system permease protein
MAAAVRAEDLALGAEPEPAQPNRAWKRFWSQPLGWVGVVILLFLILFSFVGPLFWRVSPITPNLLLPLSPPVPGHPLGTDGLGRDMLSRLMVGGQTSLIVGFSAAVASTFLGALYGTISGYVGGTVDIVMMRIVDILLSIPSIFILLFIDAIFSPSAALLVVIIALTGWVGVSRLIRAEVLSLKNRPYIEAQRAVGAGMLRIMWRGLLPNYMGTLLVTTTFAVAGAILTVAGLSFLGLGLPPPQPNWGELLSDSMTYMFQNAWWLIYPPGLCILLAELGVNFIGDAMRVAFDSRLDRRGS